MNRQSDILVILQEDVGRNNTGCMKMFCEAIKRKRDELKHSQTMLLFVVWLMFVRRNPKDISKISACLQCLLSFLSRLLSSSLSFATLLCAIFTNRVNVPFLIHPQCRCDTGSNGLSKAARQHQQQNPRSCNLLLIPNLFPSSNAISLPYTPHIF